MRVILAGATTLTAKPRRVAIARIKVVTGP